MPRRQAVAPPITVRLRTSRKSSEALRLEVRRIARRLGVSVASVRIRRRERS